MRSTLVPVAIADDHVLFRQSITQVINQTDKFQVVLEAKNGRDLLDQIDLSITPEIVILDLNMPVLDGMQTLKILQRLFPKIKVLLLSGYNHAVSLSEMQRTSACGFISKNAEPRQITEAVTDVHNGLRYFVLNKDVFPIKRFSDKGATFTEFKVKEVEFLKLLCKGLSYTEIGKEMNLSPHTIHDYRDRMFEKLEVNNKLSLMLKAIQYNLVDINTLEL